MNRSFGQPPWQAKRTSHSPQYLGNVSNLSFPNFTCGSELTSLSMCFSLILPSLYRGSTKWSQEYKSPLCSIANAPPQVLECTHNPEGSPCQFARATSNICTYTLATSCLTHSSKTPTRNLPYCSAVVDRSVTPLLSGESRSTIGMNWINPALHSSRRKR